jgi:hypothetical protein
MVPIHVPADSTSSDVQTLTLVATSTAPSLLWPLLFQPGL